MSEFIKLLLVIIVCCMLISLVREFKKEYSLIIALLCGTLIIINCLSDIRIIFEQLQSYAEISGINQPAIKIFLKCVGISVISQFACEICADSNNRFMQFCAELTGRVAILITSLPLISSILKIVANYIGA